MTEQEARAIVAHFPDDPTVYAADWAGGLWGVEAQTHYIDARGNIVHLSLGSDSDNDTPLVQAFDHANGPETGDSVVLRGFSASDAEALATVIRIMREMNPRTIAELSEPY